ncbi:MAG: ABC transporter ATP-binding protein [Rubrivivax sp.]
MAEPAECLSVRDLHAYYGESHVLHGVNFDVKRGEVVALLGRNGSGRTTTLRAMMGLTSRRSGSVRIAGTETIALPPHRIARLGVGYCPEERGIFAGLSCRENLRLPPPVGRRGMSPPGRPKGEYRRAQPEGTSVSEAQIDALFPNLRERADSPGTRLSGGEQQMLAIARILRAGADILLLDEISEGLAPVIVQTLMRTIRTLKGQGYTVVLVEQNFRFAAPLADRFYVMEHGRVVEGFGAAQLADKSERVRELLGV